MMEQWKFLRYRAAGLFARRRKGMEMVQVAILVAIAIVIGLIFRTQIQEFVDGIFADLQSSKFK
ncbi:MAG: hypothetical protein LBR44_07235 [Clostridiales Family XIII bacterium]|jgi:hypothetical protein|nr:hypothetical protein [Clostridiales Family XIII bacterium]